jgi:hypothetical protein
VVDNFVDNSRILDRGGVVVLGTRVVRGSGSFDGRSSGGFIGGGGNGRGTNSCSGSWGAGTGSARLVLFSCSCLVQAFENIFYDLSFPSWHFYSIEPDSLFHFLV